MNLKRIIAIMTLAIMMINLIPIQSFAAIEAGNNTGSKETISRSGIKYGNGKNGSTITVGGSRSYCIELGNPLSSYINDTRDTEAGANFESKYYNSFNADINVAYYGGFGTKWAWGTDLEMNDDHTGFKKVMSPYGYEVPIGSKTFSPTVGDTDYNWTIDAWGADVSERDVALMEEYARGHAGELYYQGNGEMANVVRARFASAEYNLTVGQSVAWAWMDYYLPEGNPEVEAVKQAFVWSIVPNSSGKGGDISADIFKENDKIDYDKDGDANITGEFDMKYIKAYPGTNEAQEFALDFCNTSQLLPYYKSVVWALTNYRTIPSFSYNNPTDAKANPITLYWDDVENAYVAIVADENGVLKNFDFDFGVSGITATETKEGKLIIKSKNPINGVITNENQGNKQYAGALSKLYPENDLYQLPKVMTWTYEGKPVMYTYSVLGLSAPHSHDYTDPCYWTCKKIGEYTCGFPTNRWDCETCGTGLTSSCVHQSKAGYKSVTCNVCGTNNATTSSFASNPCSHSNGQHRDSYCNVCGNYGGDTCSHKEGSTYPKGGTNIKCEKKSRTYSISTTSYGSSTKGYHVHKDNNGCKHENLDSCPAYGKPSVTIDYYDPFAALDVNTTFSTGPNATDVKPTGKCEVDFVCDKNHYKAKEHSTTFAVNYDDWQDLIVPGEMTDDLNDPVNAIIAIQTQKDTYTAKTDVNIDLIGQDDKIANYIIPGEVYKVRYTYTYEGNSKGFKIVPTTVNNMTFYDFAYDARAKVNTLSTDKNNTLFKIKDDLLTVNIPTTVNGPITPGTKKATKGTTTDTIYKLVIDETLVEMNGNYTTVETPYGVTTTDNTDNSTYKFDSGEKWYDTIYLDSITADILSDSTGEVIYETKKENEIAASSDNNGKKSIKVEKKENDIIKVTWVYETEYEVFTSAVLNANATISVGESKNQTGTHFDSKFDYENDITYKAGQSQFGGAGYFGRHVLNTKNAPYLTYAVDNKVWQTAVDVSISNPELNTGAGITQHIYSGPGIASHPLMYNLYYTVNLRHEAAYINENKLQQYDNIATPKETNYSPILYNTSFEKMEFDINTEIQWTVGDELEQIANAYDTSLRNYNKMGVVDHIQSGETYIQREFPITLPVLEGENSKMDVTIKPNMDKNLYESEILIPEIVKKMNGDKEVGIDRKYKLTTNLKEYENNIKDVTEIVYDMNDIRVNTPTNINGDNTYALGTTFSMTLSDGKTYTISDTNTKSYTQYDFAYNKGGVQNRVTFPNYRHSTIFFKYSDTNYKYNNVDIKGTNDAYSNKASQQTESYYISEVLFRSNYTKQNKLGDKQGWVDMVKDNEDAIVSAGQGFEVQVKVVYENSNLTQYLARYVGYDDAVKATSFSTSAANRTPQYCNISSMTGGYLNGYNTLDRVVKAHIIPGSNVYKDLYAYLNDSYNNGKYTVYSASGLYDTKVVFNMSQPSYSADYSKTTIVYTMKESTENGISSSYQTMKFYTDALAPDSEGDEHQIVFFTPIVAATPFDYPNTIQDRYIGDAMSITYHIKKTGGDDSIVHIVQ